MREKVQLVSRGEVPLVSGAELGGISPLIIPEQSGQSSINHLVHSVTKFGGGNFVCQNETHFCPLDGAKFSSPIFQHTHTCYLRKLTVPPVLIVIGVSWMFRLVPTFVVLLRPPGILWAPLSGVFNQRHVISSLSLTKDEDVIGVLVLSVMDHVAVDVLCSSCDNHGRPWDPSVHVKGSGSPAWDFKKRCTFITSTVSLNATCLWEHGDLRLIMLDCFTLSFERINVSYYSPDVELADFVPLTTLMEQTQSV